MQQYGKVTADAVKELIKIVGAEWVTGVDRIAEKFGYDAGTKKNSHYLPEILVQPENSRQISDILKLANRLLIPVTPRGGGTGLAGGAVPVNGGILLDLGRMDRILKIDQVARCIEVEPGVKTLQLQQAAQAHGLLYAGDPCSNDDCVIAGNIATNAGGNRAVKYGVTSDQVMELEVVTPLGEQTVVGDRLRKNSTGYNLVRLYSGSEGTLGIITKATLKLRPLAPYITDFIVAFPSLESAVDLVGKLRENRSIDPIVLELIDHRTAEAMERYNKSPVLGNPRGDVLIVQYEAWSEEELVSKQNILERVCRDNSCISIHKAADSEALWNARRAWGKALEAELPVVAGDDIVVPVDSLNDFIKAFKELVSRYKFDFRLAGHAGDGNMHLRIAPHESPIAEWPKAFTEFSYDLHKIAYGLGGRLSGEHGIGFKKKEALSRVIDPVELSLMRSIKLAFDPNQILNPGKIFDPAC